MQIIEVRDKKTEKEFLNVARVIYRDDGTWVGITDTDIRNTFDPLSNPFFADGEASRWVLKDEKGGLAGRVAAFINRKKAYTFQQPTGGMGFFECINNQDAAFLLFETCREWLEARGMKAMDGPVNFAENDNFWGLLVEGFTHPSYGMNYNKPYYKEYFEAYGFRQYFEQVSNHLDLKKPFPERFWKVADWVLSKKEFRFEHFRMAKADKFIADLKTVYDDAWAFHENFTPIDPVFLKKSLSRAAAFLEEEFIWFAYHEEKPIAFLVMLPDINQMLKPLKGKFGLLEQTRMWIMLKTKKFTRARITIMGVSPKYQRNGIESGIFWHMDKVMKNKPWYTELELSWVGDFNPKMRALHESVGATFAKRHITYRKIFSDEIEYQRSSIIPTDTREKYLRKNDHNE